MFVEFSPGFQSLVNFTEHISLLESNFQLYAMVIYLGSHFSCAVRESGLRFYIDAYKVTRAHEQTNNKILDIASVSTDSNSLRKLGKQSCDNTQL